MEYFDQFLPFWSNPNVSSPPWLFKAVFSLPRYSGSYVYPQITIESWGKQDCEHYAKLIKMQPILERFLCKAYAKDAVWFQLETWINLWVHCWMWLSFHMKRNWDISPTPKMCALQSSCPETWHFYLNVCLYGSKIESIVMMTVSELLTIKQNNCPVSTSTSQAAVHGLSFLFWDLVLFGITASGNHVACTFFPSHRGKNFLYTIPRVYNF